MLSNVLVVLLCFVLAAVLGSRLLFVLAAICWVQNIILPWWYTEGWIDEATTRSLLLVKELLLLLLLAYVLWRARWTWRWRVPPPIVWALAFGSWAIVRIGLGIVFRGEPLLDNLRLVRSVLLPVEVVIVGFLVAMRAPRLAPRFERFTVAGLTVCALLSLALYFLPSDTFWSNHVNIALYNVNVKGDPEWTVLADLGISGSGAGRSGFEALSAFRLLGTFGDPLTAGMALGLGILVLAARPRLGVGMLAAGALLGAALFLTMSRSAWVLVTVGFAYLAIVRRQPVRLGLFLAGLLVLWVVVVPLRDFAAQSIAAFNIEAGDVLHAQGILNFYSSEMLQLMYVLGTGPVDTSAQSWVLENGLAYLTVQFGFPLLVAFVGLCLSAERYVRRRATGDDVLAQLAAACALATLVVANFSFYALSFTAYFGIWSVIGVGIGSLHRAELEGRQATTLPAAAPAVASNS